MRVTIYYCDMCGREFSLMQIQEFRINCKDYHLCISCRDEVINFIETEKEKHAQYNKK